MTEAEDLQRKYYAESAGTYDCVHGSDEMEHQVALSYLSSFITGLGLTSVLDVGSGTGRALRHLRALHPGVEIMGVEPVPELVEQAYGQGVPRDILTVGRGECLPLDDRSVDAVCEFAVLHHVPRPELVVAEMMRVARRAIFLSDANRFGQGTYAVRLIKLGAYRVGLGRALRFAQTRGRGYLTSHDDGIHYSYSVFDSYRQLASWADRIILIPTKEQSSGSWFSPLLTSGHILLCAFRESVHDVESA